MHPDPTSETGVQVKVAHVTTTHRRSDIRIFQKECRTLAHHGYKVYLLLCDGQGNQTSDTVEVLDVGDFLDHRAKRMSLGVKRLLRLSLSLGADIYHLHDPELLCLIPFLRARRKQVIYDMHENMPIQLKTKPWLPEVLRNLLPLPYSIIEMAALSQTTVIFAEASYPKDYPRLRGTVILNLPLTDILGKVEQVPQCRHAVGYIGGVTALRGTKITLEALKLLKAKGFEVGWECVGPVTESHLEELSTLSEAYQLNNISFHGYLKPVEAWHVMSKCVAGLALLEPIPNYYESYPTKMFEYMALGLPVIVSEFPLYKEIVEPENCGICVNPYDAKAVAEAITWLIHHPAEAKKMGERGKKAVLERYNWQSESRKLLDLYEALD